MGKGIESQFWNELYLRLQPKKHSAHSVPNLFSTLQTTLHFCKPCPLTIWKSPRSYGHASSCPWRCWPNTPASKDATASTEWWVPCRTTTCIGQTPRPPAPAPVRAICIIQIHVCIAWGIELILAHFFSSFSCMFDWHYHYDQMLAFFNVWLYQVREVFIVHVGGTRCVTSSTDNTMNIHARITLNVECIRTCIFIVLFDV